ncbi:ornithine decarboxylase [Coccidioides immitis RS]|uniref:Ornithine decarboxylase n=4 Tax=Coccidioides immitis TaxID=5501 RepID=J3K665_COCIM|nr:ornithine decarboxylase [Coccidioides immitis RS]KMP06994.1 ornithine decarboxylase [Coccidioides immitis RMSCC 2394]KMU79923.1 ornithine decarboxylase [Coccidioides immitis RMSCC 3703]KMU86716.1 ornithine decarboxylase [Coccidioides immitis H538.4]TPX22176.1 Ornithine decarboxylase [Coccidioides immitis]EAS30032.3 ornithine decarboxylase [Coccidioides immitis RS]
MVMAPSVFEPTDVYITEKYHHESKGSYNSTNHGGPELSHAREASKELILDILQKKAASIDVQNCCPGEEDPFYVADLGEVYRQHIRWKMNLGRVKPFYAVKCNPDPQVLRLMAHLGNGFDCASKAEIDYVLAAGVDPSRIIYAHPCKTKSYLRYAAQQGVKQMTFDNADELYKIKTMCPDAELFLRILTDDSASLCRLSMKFGASLTVTRSLLELAKDLGLNVVGVSFHVGSGAEDPTAFVKAVEDARFVFDQASDIGHDLKVLDVGGGFCDETFERFAAALSDALDTYFPPHIRVIAEPGRYYVASAFTLAANVIARRDVSPAASDSDSATGPAEMYMIYLNDGVYGNFSNIVFDHQHPVAQILTKDDMASTHPVEYSIWGPTCDGIDVISKRVTLNGVLGVGNWLYFENMGAYTQCSATRFNGFTDKHDIIYISTEPSAAALMGY